MIIYTLPHQVKKNTISYIKEGMEAVTDSGGTAAFLNNANYKIAAKTGTAQVFGLADSIGSIEIGKNADLVLWDGDPLEVSTFSDAVIIDGIIMSNMTRSKRLRDRYLRVIGLD